MRFLNQQASGGQDTLFCAGARWACSPRASHRGQKPRSLRLHREPIQSEATSTSRPTAGPLRQFQQLLPVPRRPSSKPGRESWGAWRHGASRSGIGICLATVMSCRVRMTRARVVSSLARLHARSRALDGFCKLQSVLGARASTHSDKDQYPAGTCCAYAPTHCKC